MAKLAAAFGKHCVDLEAGAARRSYGQIAAHFNEHLWNRYPFAAARGAAPADPAQVRLLLQLLESNRRTASVLLKRQRDPASMAAAAFVERLVAVQPILTAMLAEDPAGGFAALDLWPQFRINRAREKGGDQIFEWTLAINGVAVGTDGSKALPWRMADTIAVGLRWAKNSALTPAADIAPQDMGVEKATVTWRYDDPWSLLRLLTEHAAPLSDLADKDARAPVVLRFKVPTRDKKGNGTEEAIVYARLAVSVHGKPERLAVPPFPTGAAPPLAVAATRMASNEHGETR
jgi:type VI protein secretion system component VasK